MKGIRTATAVIIRHAQTGNILWTKRVDDGSWVLPGGFLDEGETLDQCARREVLEEVRLEVKLCRVIGCFVTFSERRGEQVLHVVYEAAASSPTYVKVDTREVAGFIWVAPGKETKGTVSQLTVFHRIYVKIAEEARVK